MRSMSEELWTKAFRIFDPLKPLAGEELRELYIERKGAFAPWLADNIRMSEVPFKVVVSGQLGNGKSTELAKAEELLKEEFLTARLEVERLFDIHNVNHVEVLIGIGALLYKRAEEEGVKLPHNLLDKLVESVNSIQKARSRQTTFELSTPELLKMIGLGFRLGFGWETVKKEEIRPYLANILDALSRIVEEVENRTKKSCVVFVDGLDKVSNLDLARDIFAESRLLCEPPCHLVYTAPFALFHAPDFGRLSSHFSDSKELPNITIRKRGSDERVKEGYDFFEELTRRRLKFIGAEGLIVPDALRRLTEMSGGIVRDFIALMRSAVYEAMRRNLPRIDLPCAEAAVEEKRRERTRGLTQKHLDLLQRFKDDPSLPPETSPTMSELLLGCHIVYYEDGEGWYGVHPLVGHLLKGR